MNNTISKSTVFVIFLVIVAALSRLLPHIPNFTPLAAIGLLSASYFHKKYLSFVIPIFAMLISDIFIGFHTTMFWVYGSLIAIVFVGQFLLQKITIQNVVLSAFLSSIIFFTVTNFGVWLTSGMYPKNSAGLEECFLMAIPFFGNTLLGDFFNCVAIFGVYALAKRYIFSVKIIQNW